MLLIITLVVLLVSLCIGVPVPFGFGVGVIIMSTVLNAAPATLIPVGFGQVNNMVLLAVPLFIIAGGIMQKGKIGDTLVEFLELFVGKIRGGLGIVAVMACAVFGTISGSSAAALTCIGSLMAPRLKAGGYDDGVLAALIANAAPLGLLIPPSSLMILYGWVTGTSVLACFLSTVIPGIMLASLLSLVNFWYAGKNPNLNPKLAARLEPGQAVSQVPVPIAREPVSLFSAAGLKRTINAIPALFMPVLILGGIYGGIMTPTEAAAASVIYSIPVGMFFYSRGMKLREIKDSFIETGTTTGAILVMVFIILILSRFFIFANMPQTISNFLLSITTNKIAILFITNIFLIVVGILMDDGSSLLLCVPILLPLMKSIGVSPVQFAAIIGVNLGMAELTPPTAPLLYISARISGTPVSRLFRPTIVMGIFAWAPTLALTTYIPEFSLFLPRLFGLV